MKFSDDLLKSVSSILEAKPRVSFDGDKATVHSKNGTPMKSFNKKDLGNSYRKHADNFLSQNYKKLNAESVIVEELEEAKQLELPGMEQKKPKQLELPFGKKDDKKKEMKEAEDVNASNAAKATMHDCANHVRHEEYGLGQTISTMHTLEEDEDGNGYVTHYDVMFQGEDGPFIMEDVWVEELEIISEKHHGHPKGKKKMSEDIEAIEEKKGHKKDKGDMDGDGVDEPDDKEYMDNKDKAIKAAMSKKKSESPIKKVEEEAELEEAPTYVPGFMGADGKPTSKPTKKDYDSNKEYQSMKKKLGDRIPGPPAKKINKEHIESISTALQEISKKTLHNYVKSSREDSKDRTSDLHHLYHHTDGNYGDTADRFGGMHASGHDKLDKRNDGIQGAADRMADKKYGKAKPGKKTKLSKALRVHPDDKPSTYYHESQEIQEISKGVLNTYQGMRRNDHDILGSRAAYHHQRAMDHGQGNYYGGGEKGKDKRDAHKEIAKDGNMSLDKAKKKFKKVAKHRGKESDYDAERHKMDKGIDRAFNRLASDKYGKAKPGQKTKLASDVRKESNEYKDDLADRIRSHENKKERKKAEKAFTAGDYEKATGHIGGTYREK